MVKLRIIILVDFEAGIEIGNKLHCNCILFSDQHEGVASINIAVSVQNYSINRYKNLKRKILKFNTVNAFYLVINRTGWLL